VRSLLNSAVMNSHSVQPKQPIRLGSVYGKHLASGDLLKPRAASITLRTDANIECAKSSNKSSPSCTAWSAVSFRASSFGPEFFHDLTQCLQTIGRNTAVIEFCLDVENGVVQRARSCKLFFNFCHVSPFKKNYGDVATPAAMKSRPGPEGEFGGNRSSAEHHKILAIPDPRLMARKYLANRNRPLRRLLAPLDTSGGPNSSFKSPTLNRAGRLVLLGQLGRLPVSFFIIIIYIINLSRESNRFTSQASQPPCAGTVENAETVKTGPPPCPSTHQSLVPKFFRMCSYARNACNSFRMLSYEKRGEGGPIAANASAPRIPGYLGDSPGSASRRGPLRSAGSAPSRFRFRPAWW
jgi:hypothetical protein